MASRDRKTKMRGMVALDGRKNSAHMASNKISNLNATEMKRPSQAVPHGRSLSGQSSRGKMRNASGVRNTSRLKIIENETTI